MINKSFMQRDGLLNSGRRLLGCFLAAMFIFAVSGCASTMEQVNTGAEKTGEGVGRVMKVPHSASEGAAKGIAGQPESNPYGR